MRTTTTALAAALVAAPAAALACGGFFCSTQPVDQQAERVLFVDEGDSTWSVYVEIQYQGEAEGFAWVVPVPEAPELDVWYGQAFSALDQATQPTYQPDPTCGPVALARGEAEDGGDNAGPEPPADDRVNVLAREQVGPFDTVTVESRDPRALVEWLRENGFRIVPEMEPFVELYTREGLAFTAMKLLPGEGVDSIQPIKMTYRSLAPMVPLRLTSLAAMPEMGVKVWVLADKRHGPANVPSIEIPLEEIVFDYDFWTTNYIPLVARKVDEAGQVAFVTEYAQPTEDLALLIANSRVPGRAGEEAVEARDSLAALLRSRPYLTRLYTRVSPEEMDIDPMFEPDGGEDVSNVHQLPPPADGQCGDRGRVAADACAFAACGAGGVCAQPSAEAVEGRVSARDNGCACAPGSVARVRPDANGQPAISCVDVRLNFAMPGPNLGTVALANPCTPGLCGDHGECVSLNGAATCRCERGFVAVARMNDGAGMVEPTCVEPAQDIPETFYATTELREPDLPYPGRPARLPQGGVGVGGGCDASDAPSSGLALFALLAVPLARRRRRR